MLAAPGRFRAVKQVDCRLNLLPSAKPLKHRAPVHFHSGTAEIEAEVRLLDGRTLLEPGGTAYARIVLRDAALLLPGIGSSFASFARGNHRGGAVLDNGRFRYRKGDTSRLDILSSPDAADRVALLVRESEFGLGIDELIARTGLAESQSPRTPTHHHS